MSFTLLDTATRAAVAAAASQQAQLTALLAPFGAGPITARLESETGAHLRTLTLPLPSIEGTTPRRFTFGALLADAAVSTGTPGRWVFRTSGGVSIFALSAGLSGAAVNHAGPVRTLCTPTLAGVTVTADAALPLDSLPTWRTAMTATNTLYAVGNKSNLTELGPKIVWNGGTKPSKFGSDDDALTLHFGFGGCVYVPELGTFGTMVYGGTGEDIIGNQLSMMNLAENNPGWDFFAQPEYAISEAEAAANDADWYYSPTAADALPANRKMSLGYLLPTDWDGGFPVSLPTTIGGQGGGWVLRRKIKDTFGRNRPTRFRYNMPCYIPPSMTGEAAGSILVNCDNPAGPLYFNNGKAGNVGDPGSGQLFTSAQFCEYVDGSGFQLNPLYAGNVQTRAWQRLPVAAMSRQMRPSNPANHGKAVVDVARKRVWYVQTDAPYHYVDFNSGIAGAFRVAVSSPTVVIGSNFAPETETGFIATEGHPGGRLLCFQHSVLAEGSGKRNSIIVQDLDTNQIGVINLTTRGWDRPYAAMGPTAFGYDPATNRIFMVSFASPGPTPVSVPTWYCASFVVPSDVFNTSAYNVTEVELTRAAGVVTENFGSFKPANNAHGRFHTQLGGVILIQQKNSYPLAFRPA